MLKNKKVITAVAIVLIVILASGGFMAQRLLNASKEDKLSSTEAVSESVQQSSSQQEVPQLGNEKLVEDTGGSKDNGPKVLEYVVKSGDTLESIGRSYGIKASTISESNGISLNSIIREGQALRFPSIDGALYKIKSGETLWDLASTYDIGEEDIAEANKIDSPDRLQIGQEIIIPGIDRLKTAPVVLAAAKSTPTKAANTSSNIKIASRSAQVKAPAPQAVSGGGKWPVSGTVTSGFGTRWGKKHQGIDIGAPTGTNIYAFMGGTVTFSGWNSGGYGNMVVIDHGNGLQSYYAHASKVLVSAGQHVDQGTHIAEVGSTGDSTGSHCHFEIRKNGVPVNPYSYLK